MTADLSAFILARAAEDEAEVQAAIATETQTRTYYDGRTETLVDRGEWQAGPPDAYDAPRIQGTFMTIYDEGGHSAEQARHIARHDPARVLAQCAALRAVVELHVEDEGVCRVCQWDRDCDQPVYTHDDDPAWLYPCPTRRMLAGIWRDSDEWREEWDA